MDRGNHYEAAFAAYLRHHGYCYVAVDESRRALFGDLSLKNLDFIVHGPGGARLLVDVKGRQFPAGSRRRKVWDSWCMADDVDALHHWAELFGPGYRSLLVFLYHVLPEVTLPEDTEDQWTYQGRRYLVRAVAVEDYRSRMRVFSPRWGTVTLPTPVYRELVRPFRFYAHPVAEEVPF